MNIIKESELLTKKAKQIFGDVVEKAYFSQYVWKSKEWCIEEDYNEEFKRMEEELGVKSEIDIDQAEIIIKFTSGLVSFSSSEWGVIKKVKSSEYLPFDENL